MQYGTYKYLSGAGDNQIVCAGKAILHKIIFGADVASSVVQVSDSASDGDGNLIAEFTGSTLMTATGGEVEFNCHMHNGITLDLANQTDVTVVWSPSN